MQHEEEEEQVVQRKIPVRRRPRRYTGDANTNKKMLEQFALAGHGGEKNCDMMKAFVLIPENVKRMLKRVAFEENLISTLFSPSSPPSPSSGGQNFSFDLKVKQVKMGRRRIEG